MSEGYWVWKDIEVDDDLIGETITKGSGMWEKEYTYIKIPKGYGYDNYCFLLSSKCVHVNLKGCSYISICYDMNIELIYDNDLRETGKKYKRYKIKGQELFDTVFKDYEVNFIEEYLERTRKECEERERKNKKKIGRCVCGIYKGNNSIFDVDLKYTRDSTFKAYFQLENGSTFSNNEFEKVKNVKVIYEICDNISKYEFNEWENIFNAYLAEYHRYYETVKLFRKKLEDKNYTRTERRLYPELTVVTDLEDVTKYVLEANERAANDVKERLQKRIARLRKWEN